MHREKEKGRKKERNHRIYMLMYATCRNFLNNIIKALLALKYINISLVYMQILIHYSHTLKILLQETILHIKKLHINPLTGK